MQARTFREVFKEEVLKFNPYHDALGRFTEPGGATSFTYKPGQGVMYDRAIEREKKRTSSNASAKSNLVKGLGQTHAENIEKAVQNAPEHIQKTWNKYADQINVASNNTNGREKCTADGSIYVNIERDSKDNDYKPAYETTMHESGHSIDRAISREKGYRYSTDYKDGLFEKTLISEAETYVKNKQSTMAAETGGKVKIDSARREIHKELMALGAKSGGDISDIFEGATKGKVTGSAGHGKSYWADKKYAGITIKGKSVAIEAFAEMFSASTTNPDSLKQIKNYFPQSYKVFEEMLGEL